MQPDRYTSTPAPATRAASIDAGLRGHMQNVYNRMTLGVLVTAITSYFVANTPALLSLFLDGPQAYVVMFAPLAVMWFGFNPMTMPSGKLKISFFLISVLYGISLATIFIAYAKTDIARAFFIASAMFAGLSIFGYATRKNLDGLGTFAVMGVWGVLILGIINLFVGSSQLMNVISVVSIIAFAGITAWQTQTMKEMYSAAHGVEANSRMAWAAALNLYISFIAIFMHILHLLGNNR
ncbi:MAG: Bax inhibitor-1/YccA family protein [Micavibrio aeruginosavorus]|uniref:Bax inhibitor-1/YccA family protein n=1 Tax=Micavibrio aeruginosavorus TaxID=349221 RepID=A0A7T5R2U3_9BACT|nr:MAG: Bax inhibitor-1/YccA family protein [Micavibrio aeruginosavorus]